MLKIDRLRPELMKPTTFHGGSNSHVIPPVNRKVTELSATSCTTRDTTSKIPSCDFGSMKQINECFDIQT